MSPSARRITISQGSHIVPVHATYATVCQRRRDASVNRIWHFSQTFACRALWLFPRSRRPDLLQHVGFCSRLANRTVNVKLVVGFRSRTATSATSCLPCSIRVVVIISRRMTPAEYVEVPAATRTSGLLLRPRLRNLPVRTVSSMSFLYAWTSVFSMIEMSSWWHLLR